METLPLLALIEQVHRNHDHRQLQDELPAELKPGWELFFQRLGGVNRYCCIHFEQNIITAEHPIKRLAVTEAYDYAILFELLPLAILQRVHPGRWLPAHYRQLLIDHERRIHAQTQGLGAQTRKTIGAVHP